MGEADIQWRDLPTLTPPQIAVDALIITAIGLKSLSLDLKISWSQDFLRMCHRIANGKVIRTPFRDCPPHIGGPSPKKPFQAPDLAENSHSSTPNHGSSPKQPPINTPQAGIGIAMSLTHRLNTGGSVQALTILDNDCLIAGLQGGNILVSTTSSSRSHHFEGISRLPSR